MMRFCQHSEPWMLRFSGNEQPIISWCPTCGALRLASRDWTVPQRTPVSHDLYTTLETIITEHDRVAGQFSREYEHPSVKAARKALAKARGETA